MDGTVQVSPSIQQGLKGEGVVVSMAKLCPWFGVARRSVYYKPTKAPARVPRSCTPPPVVRDHQRAIPAHGR